MYKGKHVRKGLFGWLADKIRKPETAAVPAPVPPAITHGDPRGSAWVTLTARFDRH